MNFQKIVYLLRTFYYESASREDTIKFLKFMIEMLEKGGNDD